jgi:energy-coupling factor transporter ATP-binding protein EcfA2
VTEVRLDEVSFAYPMASPLLESGSMAVKSGEIVGLVGPTGAGKSSLGLLLCGLLKPTDGTVMCLDASGDVIPLSRRRGQVVALLQQPERQFFMDTCSEEISFGPANLGRKLSPAEVDGFFEMVGLNPSEFAGRDPFTLSGGEKRRLAFAAVLSMAPSVVIFDEPTAGLDPEGVGRFLVISRTLKQLGVAQVIISHDGNVIGLLADRVIYLQSPTVLRELSPQQLLTQPEFSGVVSAPAAGNH